MILSGKDYKVVMRSFNPDTDMKILCEFHKDHVQLNFPDSLYKEHLWKQSVISKYEKEPGELWIAENDSKIQVGFLWLDIMEDVFKDKNYGYVHYIHLAPEARGKGIGLAMMNFAEAYFMKNGCNEFRLGAHAENVSNRIFYEKLGYKVKRVLYEKHIEKVQQNEK